MATTEELVDELVQRFNGWNRNGDHGVLRYLNSAHEILMSVESSRTMIFDEANGTLPALDTTDGVFAYTMPANVWRVGAILVKVGALYDYPMAPLYDYGFNHLTGRAEYKNSLVIAGYQYSKVPFVKTWDRQNASNLARLMWSRNPETKTGYYFMLSYKVPTQITSETIQPDIGTPWDFDLLLPAAAKLIEGVQNGNYDEARRIVRMELRPLLWKELDAGEQGDLDNECVDRGF